MWRSASSLALVVGVAWLVQGARSAPDWGTWALEAAIALLLWDRLWQPRPTPQRQSTAPEGAADLAAVDLNHEFLVDQFHNSAPLVLTGRVHAPFPLHPRNCHRPYPLPDFRTPYHAG